MKSPPNWLLFDSEITPSCLKISSSQSLMAPSQKRKSDYASDDGFVAQDDDSDRPSKISKKSAKSNYFAIPTVSKLDEDGNSYWEISKNRRVTVSEFKGKRMVSVREYYEQGGKMLPGKKGISMTMEQYSAFVELLPHIEDVLRKHGERPPRPSYDKGVSAGDEADMDDADDETAKKANIEATSDEDEG